MNNENSTSTLSNDVPKKNPWREDVLGFSGFAKRLSQTILSISSPDGFVVGLCGSWGSGKTTALNFTKAYLRKHNQELKGQSVPVTVVDFEPWLFSGRTDLISAFFQVLAEHLPDDETKAKKLGTSLGRFAKENTDSLAGLVAAVGLTVDPTAGLLSGAATNMGKRSLDASLDRWLSTPSLQTTYAQLVERLKAEKRRIVIVIDDLDRLSSDEIRSMMQMVKSVGKLPYVTYLLSYDRKHVWAALEEGRAVDPLEPTFAEKIIQQELTLPQPSLSALLSLLDKNIGFIAEGIQASDRWYKIVSHGVRRWMKTPRDINRYTNALKFTWPALENEVDPADIIAMEGLRLFEPKIFDWIKANRDFLFSEGSFGFGADDAKNEQVEVLAKLIALHSDKSVIPLLACLFPTRAKQITGREHSIGEPHYQVVRRRGIGHVNVFQTYMAFGLSEDTIPFSAIQTVFNNLNDEAALHALFDEWLLKKDAENQPVIGELFTEIQYRMIEPNAVKPTQELLNALFSIGEAVSRMKAKRGFFMLGPSQVLYLLIADILKTYSPGDAAKALNAALTAKRNVAYGVETFNDYGRLLGEIGVSEERMDSPISKQDWEVFRDALKPLFEEDLASGEYLRYPKTWATIRAYAYFFGEDQCKVWVVQSAQEDAGFLLGTATSLLTETTGSHGTSFSIKEAPDVDIYDLEALLPIAQAFEEAATFEGEDAERLAAFIDGATSWLDKTTTSGTIS
ncbi:P-loop NTPase fold protein [Sulfitobacter sp. R18_1]|uniref:KAP family P-loop NTPase fold protein n=1 Tax=Sulfitobacter sp. R18_1 TaxID=2821104 RepID=UPI001ADAF671|nr:P-loop NTPase fold protein [Sulfitobacter sp. R18_1]MBO9429612.1 hypothetical protein [Sulfitobacter sp. R18_1]